MRWHVQGTDATTGRDVELAVDDQDSAQAVQAAIERHIVVSNVRAGPSNDRPRWIIPLTLALVIALAAVAAGLYFQNQHLHATLDQALAEQTRMANSVAQAQHTAAKLQNSGTLAKNASTQMSQLANELAAAQSRMSLKDQQLSVAHQQVDSLQVWVQKVPTLESQNQTLQTQLATAQTQLQASQSLAVRLRTELDMQGRRLDILQDAHPEPTADAHLAELQIANAALASQIDQLKSELLLLAAKPPQAPDPQPANPEPLAARWALPLSFDSAQTFLVFLADGNNVLPAASSSDELTLTALKTSHAVKCLIVTDRSRERVYSASLCLSLAADAPAQILADNKVIIADFLRTFVPALKDPSAIMAGTVQLAGQDDSHRQLFLTPDARITLWNDKTGVFTFKVESAHE